MMKGQKSKAAFTSFILALQNLSSVVQSFHSQVSQLPISTPKQNAFISKLPSRDIFKTSSLFSTPKDENANEGIDISSNPKLYKVRIPRAPGIEWGTDLSFAFVYVRAMEPAGAASLSGMVSNGDQICQLQPVILNQDEANENISTDPINLVGASFDAVMNAFATLDRSIQLVDLVFFKGTKEELKAAASGGSGENSSDPDVITITVVQNKGTSNEETISFKAPTGCNIRNELISRGINVYQSITRFTNCKGKQLCGTCIVNMTEGGMSTNRKSMDEASTLRENPENYRLACVTFAYGDVTVETYPPVNKAQWTR